MSFVLPLIAFLNYLSLQVPLKQFFTGFSLETAITLTSTYLLQDVDSFEDSFLATRSMFTTSFHKKSSL